MSYKKYQACIDACTYCAAMSTLCADACLGEPDVISLRNCIRLDTECAALCRAAVELMMLDGKFVDELCGLCAEICQACAEECEKHARMGMEHCRICAEACRLCAEVCLNMNEAA